MLIVCKKLKLRFFSILSVSSRPKKIFSFETLATSLRIKPQLADIAVSEKRKKVFIQSIFCIVA